MKRNTLSTAVLAGLTGLAGMASVSHAVNVNPDGLGQVLLYPYYTVRGGNDTLISIVNTTAQTKALKVRFIEALNSREVLDFNLYMSPYDVWTAALTVNEAGGGKMTTADTTCTVPYFQGGTPGDLGEQEFLTFGYSGGEADGGPAGVERTASGYFEIIEMGVLEAGSTPARAAKHVNGAPRSGGSTFGAPCSVLQSYWANGPWGFGFGNPGDPSVNMEAAAGGLFGSASIINVSEGTLVSYNATAIDNFFDAGDFVHTDPGSVLPNLNSGDVTSNAFVNDSVTIDTQTWDVPLFAVNAVIMQDEIYNQYNVESALAAQTEWVVTFPTKRFHTDNVGGSPFIPFGSTTAIPPFTRTWATVGGGAFTGFGRACETLQLRVWDREESEPQTGIIVSPPPPTSGFSLCRESNVIRFTQDGGRPAETEIFGEPDRTTTNLAYTNFQLPTGFESGWVTFDMATNGQNVRRTGLPTANGIVPANTSGDYYTGLPLLGFKAVTYTNGALDGVLANYGGTFNHRGSRNVVRSGTGE